MPGKPYHQCTYPGCHTLVNKGARCPVHAALVQQQRGSSTERGYGYAWRKRRDAFLQQHPWCEDPFGDHNGLQVLATHVDHKVPKSQGGIDDETNYQSLCSHCHDKKTAKFDGGFGNKKVGRGY